MTILGSNPLLSRAAAMFAVKTGSSGKEPDFWTPFKLEGFGPGTGGLSYVLLNWTEALRFVGSSPFLGAFLGSVASTLVVCSDVLEDDFLLLPPRVAAMNPKPQALFFPVRLLGVSAGVTILAPEYGSSPLSGLSTT
ncbi:hypothetical protein PC116_g33250 [Phytophthora cactorum]|nr:hypothetical protein PC116_g33250 [Phytophthora cactorum]